MYIYRVKLDENMEVINECLLLQPISFKLAVQRNLSVGWFTELPDLDITGSLESIHVSGFIFASYQSSRTAITLGK